MLGANYLGTVPLNNYNQWFTMDSNSDLFSPWIAPGYSSILYDIAGLSNFSILSILSQPGDWETMTVVSKSVMDCVINQTTPQLEVISITKVNEYICTNSL